MSEERENVDSNADGVITNPELHHEGDTDTEGNGVGDAGDYANDLRFSEEEQLISEQNADPET